MNAINASDETVRAVAAALGKARLYDDRFGGADAGRIAAWAEVVEPHRLSRDDLMAGVVAYYGEPHDGPLMPATLVAAARAIRRERCEREPDEVRNARQEALAAKVADEMRDLASAKTVDVGLKYQRPKVNPLLVRCPHPPCSASVGQPCRSSGRPLLHAPRLCHPSRLALATGQQVSS